jgi:hypothetical protein
MDELDAERHPRLIVPMIKARPRQRLAQDSLRALAISNLHARRPDLRVQWFGATRSAMLGYP